MLGGNIVREKHTTDFRIFNFLNKFCVKLLGEKCFAYSYVSFKEYHELIFTNIPYLQYYLLTIETKKIKQLVLELIYISHIKVK